MKIEGYFLRALKSKKDGRDWAVFIINGPDGLPDCTPVWVLLTLEDVDYLAGAQPFDVVDLAPQIRGRNVSYIINREVKK